MALPAAVVAAGKVLAPIVIDYGLKKLREAYNNSETTYKDETGEEFDASAAGPDAVEQNEALMSGIPETTEMSQEEKDKLVQQGARLDELFADDSIQWDGKDQDREAVIGARAGLVEAKAEYGAAVESAMRHSNESDGPDLPRPDKR
ncbi:MAG: hypothetical protein Alpg2KO_07470 [Alphaproteobacteria bacterium]